MTPATHIITQLELENKKLREKLSIAEQWIWREISEMHFRKMKADTTEKTKNGLLETDAEIEQRIQKYFWSTYCYLSSENREILIESEKNFSYLIKQKEIDGFIVTNAYQKIIENIFEEQLISHFRDKQKKARLNPGKNDLLEKTIYKVVQNNFHLSIGKIYLILRRCLEENPGGLIELLRETVEEENFYAITNEGSFWEYFTDIIETHAFWEKRHAGKVTLKDARFLREKITGNFEKESFLKILLSHCK